MVKSLLKLIACILAIVMALCLVSCNNAPESQPSQATSESTQTSATTTKKSSNSTNPPEPQEPEYLFSEDIKNLIIIIGDGMGPQHITAGQISENKTYGFTEWSKSFCNTNSIDSSGAEVVTDSAASATALATGTLTRNGFVGKDKSGKDLENILEIAKKNKKAVGVVTSDYLHGATPAGFSAHSSNRNNTDEITRSQISSGIDFLCGLRSDDFYEEYLRTIELFKIHYATDLSDKEAIMAAKSVFLPIDLENGKSGAVALKDATAMAIEYLERDTDGFVLMVEQAYIDKYSHSNTIDKVLERVKSLNDTVDTVMEWVGDRTDTAVIVTADHETGGLSGATTPDYEPSYIINNNTLYYDWSSVDHTKTMVEIFVYGIDIDFASISKYKTADKIRNTDVFVLMKEILRFE